MNGADLIARILKREAVAILPAFPHSDLIDTAARVGIRPIIVCHERQALHMTDALGAHAERVEEPSCIGPAFKRALAVNDDDRPELIEVISADDGPV